VSAVLQQRESPGPVGDVGDHLGEQTRLDDQTGLIGWGHDGALELLG
jgi:hypothetical protein